jgi:glycosyltransferase involved in cell wall biosynthesis
LSDERKGFKQITQALQKLKGRNDLELVVFGSVKPKQVPDFSFPTHYVGYISDDISLATLYSSADLTLVPSLQEALGNVTIESLSCGTPVVAFDIGGSKDIIDHKINGYLAKPYDPDDFANGIRWVLDNPNYNELRQNAREKILKEFDSKVVARKYIELFNQILSFKK